MKHEIGSFYEVNEDTETTGIPCKDEEDMQETGWSSREGKICLEKEIGLEQWMGQASEGMDILLVCSGREAVEAALIDMEQREAVSGKVCLLPQYTCDTTIIPFEKRGWELHFFPVNQRLQPEKESFQKLLEQIAPDVLFAHTYYGVDTLAEVRGCIQKQREKGMVFVEDMTQSLALWKPGGIADYYVGSLRKWFAVPDGGFVAAGHKILVPMAEEKKAFVGLKLRAQKLKYKYLYGSIGAAKEEFLKLNGMAEQYLYENDEISAVSEFAQSRFQNLDIQMNFQRRRENALCLCQAVRGCKKIKAVLDMEDSSPLYVPVYAKEREKLQEFLRENNIFAPVLWPVPGQEKEKLDQDVEFIFQHLLALPCDQRYGTRDMERIIQCLLEYERK